MHYYGVNCYNNKKNEKPQVVHFAFRFISQYQYKGQSKSFLAKYEEVELEI